jgi:hypothetical protein
MIFWKKLCSNCNEGQNWMSCTVIINSLIHWIYMYTTCMYVRSFTLARSKGPCRPDAIWQRDANFQFSMTFNFNIFLCFSNIRNHLTNFSYLVCISCKIFIRWRFYLFLKTENSRRVVDSRSVCMDFKPKLNFLWGLWARLLPLP